MAKKITRRIRQQTRQKRKTRRSRRRNSRSLKQRIEKALVIPSSTNQVTKIFQKYIPKKEVMNDANHKSNGNMIPGMRKMLEKIHLLK